MASAQPRQQVPCPTTERKPLRRRQGQEGLGLRLDRLAPRGGGDAGRPPSTGPTPDS